MLWETPLVLPLSFLSLFLAFLFLSSIFQFSPIVLLLQSPSLPSGHQSLCSHSPVSSFSLLWRPCKRHVIGLCNHRLFIIYHLFTLVALGKDQRSNTIILNALWCDSVICGTCSWLNVPCFSFLPGRITLLNLNSDGIFHGLRKSPALNFCNSYCIHFS